MKIEGLVLDINGDGTMSVLLDGDEVVDVPSRGNLGDWVKIDENEIVPTSEDDLMGIYDQFVYFLCLSLGKQNKVRKQKKGLRNIPEDVEPK